MAPKGRPLPALYAENFEFIEKLQNKSNRGSFKCSHCTTETRIENRDNNLAKHLASIDKCPNAPADVRNQARRFLMGKVATSSQPGSLPMDVGPMASGLDSGDSGAVEQLEADARAGGVAAVRKKKHTISLDGYVDHPLTPGQQDQADLYLFR